MIDELVGYGTLALGSMMLLSLFVFVALDQFSREAHSKSAKNPIVDDARHLKEKQPDFREEMSVDPACSTLEAP